MGDILSAIGNTDLVRLPQIEQLYCLKAKLYAKLEMQNLTGSIKDRTALYLINGAKEKGLLKPGSVIIEPTSGNTGIALAAIGKIMGYRIIITMPENMSKERIDLIKMYGAEVVLTPKEEGMQGAVNKAKELVLQIPDSIIASQFTNPDNARAHFETTGPEIYRQLDNKVDCLVAGIGTGGTITGTARYLKSKTGLKVVGVEPLSSPLLTKKVSGPHKIQGIGANFIPSVLDLSVVDQIIDISDEDAFDGTRLLLNNCSIFAGISSGAALKAAIQTALDPQLSNKNIVVILPDSGTRYLSSGIYGDSNGR